MAYKEKIMTIPKTSIFNWIGGKKWLTKDIQSYTDLLSKKEIDVYIEPFCGGLGSFRAIFPLLESKKVKTIILNDVNELIINTFNTIKNDKESLSEEYEKLAKRYIDVFPTNKFTTSKYNTKTKAYTVGDYSYQELHKTNDKKVLKSLFLVEANDFYKDIKKSFNIRKLAGNIDTTTIAQFLFLMTNCFNGVYRENGKGEFNTPFNWNNKPELGLNKLAILDEYNVFFNSINIIFKNKDVFELLEEYKTNSNVFIYLDPPYFNKEGNENKYNKNHFGYNEQLELIDTAILFDYVLYSNHYEDFIIDRFKSNCKIIYKEVKRKNIMSSKSSTRSEEKSEIILIKTN
jgi:DNA adenine methylase